MATGRARKRSMPETSHGAPVNLQQRKFRKNNLSPLVTHLQFLLGGWGTQSDRFLHSLAIFPCSAILLPKDWTIQGPIWGTSNRNTPRTTAIKDKVLSNALASPPPLAFFLPCFCFAFGRTAALRRNIFTELPTWFPWVVTVNLEANNVAGEVQIIASSLHYLVNIKFYLPLIIKWHPSTSFKAL